MFGDESNIILPEHHNFLVDAAKEVFKMLEEAYINCSMKLSLLDDAKRALNKLREVKTGDEVLTTDHNDFIYFLREVSKSLKRVYRRIDLQEWDFVSMDVAVENIREVQTGDIITPEDFDSIGRALAEVYKLLGKANLRPLKLAGELLWAKNLPDWHFVVVGGLLPGDSVVVGAAFATPDYGRGGLAKLRLSDGRVISSVLSPNLTYMTGATLTADKSVIVVTGGTVVRDFVGAWRVSDLAHLWTTWRQYYLLPLYKVAVSSLGHIFPVPQRPYARVYDVRDGSVIKADIGYLGSFSVFGWAAYTPDGSLLVVNNFWFSEIGEHRRLFEAYSGYTYDRQWAHEVDALVPFIITKDGKQILRFYATKVAVHNTSNGELIREVELDEPTPDEMTLDTVSMTDDGKFIVLGGHGQVQIRWADDFSVAEIYTESDGYWFGEINSLAIAPDLEKAVLADVWHDYIYAID